MFVGWKVHRPLDILTLVGDVRVGFKSCCVCGCSVVVGGMFSDTPARESSTCN